mmetsp:Transcript_82625/g.198288  ORF Transcript_82625/g.198288 Transcript_82625/m.198288 type:complete len:222 (+) Transcript_82625:500-1165(+)
MDRSHHEGCLASAAVGLHLGSSLQQRLDHLQVAKSCGPDEGHVAFLIVGLRPGSCMQQRLDQLQVPMPCSIVEGCAAEPVRSARISLLSEELLHTPLLFWAVELPRNLDLPGRALKLRLQHFRVPHQLQPCENRQLLLSHRQLPSQVHLLLAELIGGIGRETWAHDLAELLVLPVLLLLGLDLRLHVFCQGIVQTAIPRAVDALPAEPRPRCEGFRAPVRH